MFATKTKHYTTQTNKDWATRNPLKIGNDLRCSSLSVTCRGWWFSTVFLTNKTDRHALTEKL